LDEPAGKGDRLPQADRKIVLLHVIDLFREFHGFEPDFDADLLQHNLQQFPEVMPTSSLNFDVPKICPNWHSRESGDRQFFEP